MIKHPAKKLVCPLGHLGQPHPECLTLPKVQFRPSGNVAFISTWDGKIRPCPHLYLENATRQLEASGAADLLASWDAAFHEAYQTEIMKNPKIKTTEAEKRAYRKMARVTEQVRKHLRERS